MFIGEYAHILDAKGRIFVPAGFREALGDRFILTKGLDRCLFGFTLPEWGKLEEKLHRLPFARAEARAFTRLFFSGAAAVEVDRQGRILIPANLRAYAGLAKDVIVLGVSSRVEFWAKEEWERYSAQTQAKYEQIAEKIVDLNFLEEF
ncbi:MAG TPA: division/cell wall cluster transcriptional repressor MraZ [Desulfotomaculum sp.]|nr:division/cell wall cluster transcriptional repressor MraZ [Desulfotomaculum sp.]